MCGCPGGISLCIASGVSIVFSSEISAEILQEKLAGNHPGIHATISSLFYGDSFRNCYRYLRLNFFFRNFSVDFSRNFMCYHNNDFFIDFNRDSSNDSQGIYAEIHLGMLLENSPKVDIETPSETPQRLLQRLLTEFHPVVR